MDQGMTGAKADIVEHLTSEHRQVEQLWSQLQVAHANGDRVQADLGGKIVRMLSQHDAVELQVLYPEVRKALPDGDRLAEHSLDEHRVIRDLLSHVDGRDPADAEVFAAFGNILVRVQEHVAEEEQTLFPLLRANCSEAQLMRLGEMLDKAEKMAPTHPHPHTPDSKVGATIAGAAASMVDKVRDAVSQDRPS